MAGKRRQQGFTLLETAIVMAVAMIAFASIVQFGLAKLKQDGGHAAGARIAQYNAAVAAFINASQPNVPLGNFNGVNWLQDAATCPGGTAAAAFLPCGFDPWLPYGLAYNTTIALNGPSVNATTLLGPAREGNLVDRVAGGHVINGAEAFMGIYSQAQERAVGYLSYAIDPATGNLTATVDTGVQATPWLNRDGSNSMTGNLNMGNNNINNAQDVNANRNVQATNNVSANNNVTAGLDMAAGRNVIANTSNTGGDIFLANTGYTNPLTGIQDSNISLSGSSFGMSYVNNANNRVTKPTCPPGRSPQIFMIPGQWNIGGVSEPVGSVDLRSVEHANDWFVYFYVTTPSHPNGYVPPNGSATALVATSCQ